MPTYQYACTDTDCGARFELVQSFTDPAASECPKCAGPVRKVYSSVGVVFKGSGFYRTDSRAESRSSAKPESGKSESGKSDSGKESSSSSSSSSKSESSKSESSKASSGSSSSSSTASSAAAS